MQTRWTRKVFLGIETPLDIAMALVRDDKLAKAQAIRLTPKQDRKLDLWLKSRQLR